MCEIVKIGLWEQNFFQEKEFFQNFGVNNTQKNKFYDNPEKYAVESA